MRLTDKVVVVTGAASGIGKAIAIRSAREGATVAVADLDSEGAATVVAEIARRGRRAIPVTMDVTDELQVENAVKKIVDSCGTIDSL